MHVKIIKPIESSKKKRVCAYARVSSGSYAQGESLENQITYYEKKIKANPDYKYSGVFYDSAMTGTKANRPGLQKMINLCKEGKIDVILTKSISRLARNTVTVLQIARDLKDIGVEIIFERENISTTSNNGELLLSILASIAEEEARSASENVKWRIRKKFENGELILMDSKRFLGYDKNKNGDLVINIYEAMIVKTIFKEYLKGNGALRIAKMLNKLGFKTVTGGRWSDATILAVLKNEKYKGDVLLQKTYTPDCLTKKQKVNYGEVDKFYITENHPPIVSKGVWEKVQLEIKRRDNLRVKSRNYQNRYKLSGMLYCSKCGAVLKRRIWNSKLTCRKVVWLCSGYIKNGKDFCIGTTIEDSAVQDVNKPTIVKEERKNGKKYYYYTSKSSK